MAKNLFQGAGSFQAAASARTSGGSSTAGTGSARKEQVRALLKAIETGDQAAMAVINAANYKQHNLGVGDGVAGFAQVLQALPKDSARVNTVRVFEDGDYVFAHTDYNFFGPKVGFDVFRFENGKIVEHWDNLQAKPNKPNPSQRTMLDGPTTAAAGAPTEANKRSVERFLQEVLVQGKMQALPNYFNGDHYLQHNPQVADGLSGLGQAMAHMAKAGMAMAYSKVHRVLGEGDFVLSISEGTLGKQSNAFYDLFRLENGKIVEHWDVIEEIPAKTQWKNNNGKF